MDTSAIPVNIAALYDVFLQCAGLLAVSWGVSKVIQLFRRK